MTNPNLTTDQIQLICTALRQMRDKLHSAHADQMAEYHAAGMKDAVKTTEEIIHAEWRIFEDIRRKLQGAPAL